MGWGIQKDHKGKGMQGGKGNAGTMNHRYIQVVKREKAGERIIGKYGFKRPQKRQYEQACNAEALRAMGVPVLKSPKLKHLDQVHRWIGQPDALKMVYPDATEALIDDVILRKFQEEDPYTAYLERGQYSLKRA